MPTLTYRKLRSLSLVLAVALTGCASLPDRQLHEGQTLPSGESLVFGAVTFDPPLRNGNLAHTASYAITVRKARTMELVYGQRVEEQGAPFYWHLPPGEYVVLELSSFENGFFMADTTTSRRIYAEFKIDKPQELIYVGRLKCSIAPGYMHTSVVDECESAKNELVKKFPKLQGETVKKIFKVEVQR